MRTVRGVVEHILDAAGQKGTGKWTVEDSIDRQGIPSRSLPEAVYARCVSALKESACAPRVSYRGLACASTSGTRRRSSPRSTTNSMPRNRELCAGLHAHASRGEAYGWNLHYGRIALLWRGGCIIRSRFLGKIKEAFDRNGALENLLLDPYFKSGNRTLPGRLAASSHGRSGGRNPNASIWDGACILRLIPLRAPARESPSGPARLFRCAHLRANGPTAR